MTRKIFLTISLLAVAWSTVGTASGEPSGGFVTGGGWITSPAGANIADTSLTGNAYFGFASSYKKGAAAPIGNTEFLFQVGDMNFRSSSYEWLAIAAGTRAQFKGEGTINGDALSPDGVVYKFMITVEDKEPDTFRIKIWYDYGGEVVVYDNGSDQAIAGGSIVIHASN